LRGSIIFIFSLYLLITIVTGNSFVRVKLNRVNVIGFFWVNCNTDGGAKFATSKVKVIVMKDDHVRLLHKNMLIVKFKLY